LNDSNKFPTTQLVYNQMWQFFTDYYHFNNKFYTYHIGENQNLQFLKKKHILCNEKNNKT
jgi:hypothetical protein